MCSSQIEITTNTVAEYDLPDQYELAVNISDAGYFRKWIKCDNCDLTFSIYSRSIYALDQLYEELYRKVGSVTWRKYGNEQMFEIVRNLPPELSETVERVSWIKDEILFYQSKNLLPTKLKYSLLDIGGGTGSFAYEFKDQFWETFIIDPDPTGAFIEKHGVNFRSGYFDPSLYLSKFDLISLVFVLEHLVDPISLLKEICKTMYEGSFLYIEVPDEVAFIRKAKDDDIFNSCHLFMFNPVSLTKLLSLSGFELMSLNRTQTARGHYSLRCLAKMKTLR